MKRTTQIQMICLVLAWGILTAVFAMNRIWDAALITVAAGGLAFYGQRKRWHWMNGLMAAAHMILAVIAVLLARHPFALVAAVALALAAWDTGDFLQRVKTAGEVRNAEVLEKKHLAALAAVIGISLPLAAAVLLIQVSLSYPAIFVIALVFIILLSQFFMRLRKFEVGDEEAEPPV